MTRLRVTVVTHNLEYEGAPLVLFELIRGLANDGVVSPSIVSMSEGPLRADYERLGFPVRVVGTPLRTVRVALSLVRRSSDVLVANTVLAHWAIDSAHRARRPSLWFIHESEPAFSLLSSPRARKRAERALDRAQRVVFPSHATRAVYDPRAERPNLSVFHNGFDRASYDARTRGRSREEIRARLGLASGTIAGTLVGTVTPRKSQLDAVRAVAALPKDLAARLALFVVGDVPGEYSRTIHAAAQSLPPGTVRFVPYASDVLDYWLAADFALSTSRIEAFPKVVQEAMYFGLPLVVAPVFGIAEQVEDEKSALFFPPGDTGALAVQLGRIIESEALRRRLGNAARDALGRLPSMEDMVAQYGRWLREATIV